MLLEVKRAAGLGVVGGNFFFSSVTIGVGVFYHAVLRALLGFRVFFGLNKVIRTLFLV
jgi:hypothetical protein